MLTMSSFGKQCKQLKCAKKTYGNVDIKSTFRYKTHHGLMYWILYTQVINYSSCHCAVNTDIKRPILQKHRMDKSRLLRQFDSKSSDGCSCKEAAHTQQYQMLG